MVTHTQNVDSSKRNFQAGSAPSKNRAAFASAGDAAWVEWSGRRPNSQPCGQGENRKSRRIETASQAGKAITAKVIENA